MKIKSIYSISYISYERYIHEKTHGIHTVYFCYIIKEFILIKDTWKWKWKN